MFDDYVIDRSVRTRGIIGTVHESLKQAIVSEVYRDPLIDPESRGAIAAALGH